MIPIVLESWWAGIGLKTLTVLTAVWFVLPVDDVLMLTSGNEFEFVSVYLVTPSPLSPSTLSTLPPMHYHSSLLPIPMSPLSPSTLSPLSPSTLFTHRYYQLLQVRIPSDVSQQFLNNIILNENAEQEQFAQDASVETLAIERDVQDIMNQATELREAATANATLTRAIAQANVCLCVCVRGDSVWEGGVAVWHV